ncbi:hypothetical protein NT6N_23260 [Oceaniferula spumae]|uniref:Uncharacterized protein n=1 Tax=Oceaniferula spumae TaxID=2979115 RepID=A0AAT9FMP9_9BACT
MDHATAPVLPTNSFARQLRYWAIHCGLTAIPSFCIALTRFNSPGEIAAMICGILTFVFGYAFLTSAGFYTKIHNGLLGKAVNWGARIRMIISLCSIPLLFSLIGKSEPTEEVLFVPDFWFGFIALLIFSQAAMIFGVQHFRSNTGEHLNFLEAYAVTVIEGVLISFSLVLIAFISLVFLNYKRNRQRLPSDFIPR